MKIFYITKYFPPEYGGIENLSKSICDHFCKKNHIEVVSFSKNQTITKKYNSYRVHFFKSIFNFFSTPISFQMLNYIRNNCKNFDYVHLHLPNPWATICLLFIPKNKIVVSWGSDIISQKILKLFYKPIQNLTLNKAAKIIGLSRNYTSYSSDLKKFKSKITIIPPLQKILKIKKKNIKKNYKKINILTIGRLVDYKRQDIAIRTMSFLPKKYFLTIIGNGRNERKLKNIIYSLNLKSRVKILKNVNDIEKNNFLLKSDIFLMCSDNRAESFGLAILEAISAGLPIVIPFVKGSGMNDMVVDGSNGYKFKLNSPQDCSKKIKKIIINKKIVKFSKNSLNIYKKNFHPNKIYKKLDKIYS